MTIKTNWNKLKIAIYSMKNMLSLSDRKKNSLKRLLKDIRKKWRIFGKIMGMN